MKQISHTSDFFSDKYLELQAVYDFIQSHPLLGSSVLKGVSFTSFFSFKSFEEDIKQEFEEMADQYSSLCIQAKELASIASNEILQVVTIQLEFKLEEWEYKKDNLLKKYSTIANIFALVCLWLVVYGKLINDQMIATMGLLTCILSGIILLTSIVTIFRKLNIEAEMFRYYIRLLKQAQI